MGLAGIDKAEFPYKKENTKATVYFTAEVMDSAQDLIESKGPMQIVIALRSIGYNVNRVPGTHMFLAAQAPRQVIEASEDQDTEEHQEQPALAGIESCFDSEEGILISEKAVKYIRMENGFKNATASTDAEEFARRADLCDHYANAQNGRDFYRMVECILADPNLRLGILYSDENDLDGKRYVITSRETKYPEDGEFVAPFIFGEESIENRQLLAGRLTGAYRDDPFFSSDRFSDGSITAAAKDLRKAIHSSKGKSYPPGALTAERVQEGFLIPGEDIVYDSETARTMLLKNLLKTR